MTMTFQFFLALLFHLAFVTSGLDVNGYSSLCDSAFCRVVDGSLKSIEDLRKVIDGGACIPGFGQQADEICNAALEKFASEAPLPEDDKDYVSVYDKKVEELERVLDAPLHVLYLKQLTLLREKALRTFKASVTAAPEGGNEYDAMLQVDEMFKREAEESTRQNPDWEYARDLNYLKQSLAEITSRAKKYQELKLSSAKQTQQTLGYLQQQQQQMQAIQQQVQGSAAPWSAAVAYRIPDSNINLSFNYQQGRSNLQISCVPDESVPLLGPNGFVHGVTPGNIGLSFNINV